MFSPKTLAGQNRTWKLERRVDTEGRVERVQEMGEMVQTVLGIRDGIRVHSSFHTVENCFYYER
jgi:hypothetical protein